MFCSFYQRWLLIVLCVSIYYMKNFNQQDRSESRRDFGRRNFNSQGGRRDMFKATCASCGKICEVPFEPRDGRPVYCSDCFEKKDGGSRNTRKFYDRDQRRPDFERKDIPAVQNNGQLEEISIKLDKILEVLTTYYSNKKVEQALPEKKEEVKSRKKISKTIKKKPAISNK